MDAYGQMLAKMLRLMPPPAPQKGWGLVRLMAAARQLGPIAENRQALAETQLHIGATQNRIDDASTTWSTDPDTWQFEVSPENVGAQGFYLDAWGNTLGVPRAPGEADANYAPRIVYQVAQASQTNRGVAAMLEHYLNTRGAYAIDAAGVLPIVRLNDKKMRLNAPAQILNSGVFPIPSSGDLSGCFFTVVPGAFSPAACMAMVKASKAAGTRHLATLPVNFVPALTPKTGSAYGTLGLGTYDAKPFNTGALDTDEVVK